MNTTKLKDTLPQFADTLKNALTELGNYDLCTALTIDHICIRLDIIELIDAVKEGFDLIKQENKAVLWVLQ